MVDCHHITPFRLTRHFGPVPSNCRDRQTQALCISLIHLEHGCLVINPYGSLHLWQKRKGGNATTTANI